MSARRLPARQDVTNDMPLRLDVAAALAFPDGSIGASSLRREAEKGRLTVWRIANKDMTTLAEIDRMKALCRVEPKEPGFGSDQKSAVQTASSSADPHGQFRTAGVASARDALLKKLSGPSAPSRSTSRRNTSPSDGNVVSLTSR